MAFRNLPVLTWVRVQVNSPDANFLYNQATLSGMTDAYIYSLKLWRGGLYKKNGTFTQNRNSKNEFKNIAPVQIFVDQSLQQCWGIKTRYFNHTDVFN